MPAREEPRQVVARRILWGDREDLLPHLLEHDCGVADAVQALCDDARWTYDSYLLAALFDRDELLAECPA